MLREFVNTLRQGLFVIFPAVIWTCIACDYANSANLTLYFDTPSLLTTDVVTGQLSDPISIGVFNDTAVDLPEDLLTAWQVSLVIVPEPGSTGTLSFAAPTGPTAPEPPNDVLDGVNAGISVSNSGDTLFAFDFNFPPTGGVQVPLDPGSLLMTVQLLSSVDASGDFGIYAIPGLGGSEWTDANPVIQLSRAYDNVPIGAGPALIGTVNVDIPEPNSYHLIMLSILATYLILAHHPPNTLLQRSKN